MIIKIRAELSAPLAVRHALQFDAVMAYYAAQLQGAPPVNRATPVDDLVRPSIPLFILHAAGHRVAMVSSWSMPENVVALQESLTKRLDSGDEFYRGGKHHISSGPGRDYCLRFPTYAIPWVEWTAVGNRNGIRKMLRYITHLGSYLRHGYGEVKSWSVDPTESDPLDILIKDGRASRHLPVEWCEWSDHQDHGAVEPPYWHSGRFVSRVPSGTRCQLTPEVIETVKRCR